MAYTAQNLEHVVSVFYSSEHSNRAEAHKWLTEAQRCPEAWSFVWELLNSQKSTEIQFFAATTLHTKLQKCWNEVHPSNYEELKNRIMHAITVSFHGPKIVLNRLCISLAAFVLQQGGQGLVETVQQLSTIQNIPLLIEILSVIPEEFNNMTMAVSDRTRIRESLQQMSNQILEMIIKHLEIDSQNKEYTDSHWVYQVGIWQGACQCASAWIQLGGLTPLQCLPIVTAALQILHIIYRGKQPNVEPRRGELSLKELEACEAALNTASATLTQPDAGRHPETCSRLLRLLLDAVEPILQVEDVLHSPNEELVSALYNALTAAGEFHGRWIALALSEESTTTEITDSEQIQNKNENMRCARDLVRLLLCCSGAAGAYPTQESHSKLAFSFWFTLQDEGLWCGWESTVDVTSVNQALRGCYEELVAILLRKSTMPALPAELTAEDDELMRCYRQDIGDTMVYCYTVLGNSLIIQLENLMKNLVTNCLVDGGCDLEAVLHAFLGLGEFVDLDASSSLISLMKVLIELPYDKLHQQVLKTALGCFVSYAGWVGGLGDPAMEEIVGRGLTITWMGIENKELTPLAVLALKAFCQQCNRYIKPHAHQLLQAMQSAQGKLATLHASQLMIAAGWTAATLSISDAAPYLNGLVTPLVAKLQMTQKKQLSGRKLTQCSDALQLASAFLGSFPSSAVKHAYIPLILLLPTFGDVVQHEKLTEPLFHLIKLVITSLQDECIPLLPDLTRIINTSLEIYPHPNSIDVCKSMSLMFPETGSDVLRSMTTAVLSVCGEAVTKEQSLSNHAQLLDSFYLTLSAIFMKNSQLLQGINHQMQDIVHLGIMTLSLPEQGPTKAACNFFGSFSRINSVELLPHAPNLVRRIIHCIGTLVPRNHIDPFTDLLWKLGRAQWVVCAPGENTPVQGPAHLSAWLRNALAEPGFPSDLATTEVKDKFLIAVIKNHSHKRKLMEAVREFTLSCRGLLGVYGEMTQPMAYFNVI